MNFGIQLFLTKQQHINIVLKKSSNAFISNACFEHFPEILKSSDCVASTQIFHFTVYEITQIHYFKPLCKQKLI